MLVIQKVRIGLRQAAATMNQPTKLTRAPKVSALPCVREGYVAGVISR
jgi:hypothetical protein